MRVYYFIIWFFLIWFFFDMPIAAAEEVITLPGVPIQEYNNINVYKKVFFVMIYGSLAVPPIIAGAVHIPLIPIFLSIFGTTFAGYGLISILNTLQEPTLIFILNYYFFNILHSIINYWITIPHDVVNICLSGNLLGVMAGSVNGVVNPTFFENGNIYSNSYFFFNWILGSWIVFSGSLVAQNYNELIFFVSTGMISGQFASIFFSYSVYGLKYFFFSHLFKKWQDAQVVPENATENLIGVDYSEISFFENLFYLVLSFIKFIIKLFFGV